MGYVMKVARQAATEVRLVIHGEEGPHGRLRDRIIVIVFFTLVVDLVASVAILFLERHAPGTEITNFGDSIFWVTTQLLTVSSQLPNPIGAGARVLDVFLQAYAISVVATLAGSFAAFFHAQGSKPSSEQSRASAG